MPFQKDLSFDERGRFGLGRSEKAKIIDVLVESTQF